MLCLRRHVEIYARRVPARRFARFLLMDFYREVGATKLAEPAPDAGIGIFHEYYAVAKRQYVLGAEGDANIASLAPPFTDDMLVSFLVLFFHDPTLV